MSALIARLPGYRPVPSAAVRPSTWLLALAFLGLVFVSAMESTLAATAAPTRESSVVLHMGADPSAADVVTP